MTKNFGKIIDKLHGRIINFHPPVPARALESENSLLQEEKGMIMRENTSNRATLEAKIQRYIIQIQTECKQNGKNTTYI